MKLDILLDDLAKQTKENRYLTEEKIYKKIVEDMILIHKTVNGLRKGALKTFLTPTGKLSTSNRIQPLHYLHYFSQTRFLLICTFLGFHLSQRHPVPSQFPLCVALRSPIL